MLLLHLTVNWRLAKKHYVVGLIPEGLAGVRYAERNIRTWVVGIVTSIMHLL